MTPQPIDMPRIPGSGGATDGAARNATPNATRNAAGGAARGVGRGSALGAGLLYGPLPSGRSASPEAARNAFEALLLGEMLKPLESSLRESGLFPRGAPGDIYAHFWKTHLSQLLADSIDLATGSADAIPGAAGSTPGSVHSTPSSADSTPGTLEPTRKPIDLVRGGEDAFQTRRIRDLDARDYTAATRRTLAAPEGARAPEDPSAHSASSALSGPSALEDSSASPQTADLPVHLRPVLRRLSTVDEVVRTAARESGISSNWVRAVITQESGGRPEAESSRGAQGLMQLMPATARALGVADSLDPQQNVRGGTRYLTSLMRRFPTPELALAAYNAGPTRVDDFGGVPPFHETQEYVRNVVALKGLFDRIYPGE